MKIFVFSGGASPDLFVKVDKEAKSLFLMSERTNYEFKELRSLMESAGQWDTSKDKLMEELRKAITNYDDEELKDYVVKEMQVLGLSFKGFITEENLEKHVLKR